MQKWYHYHIPFFPYITFHVVIPFFINELHVVSENWIMNVLLYLTTVLPEADIIKCYVFVFYIIMMSIICISAVFQCMLVNMLSIACHSITHQPKLKKESFEYMNSLLDLCLLCCIIYT